MDSFVNSVKSAALSVGQILKPVLRDSKFRETGVLTPEEFVIAGDYLVYSCPTWSWAKATRSFLPADKQFLITRNLPCTHRCSDMHYDSKQEKIIYSESRPQEEGYDTLDDDEGWVDTHHYSSSNPFSLSIADVGEAELTQALEDVCNVKGVEEDSAPAVDMDDFILGGGLEAEDPNRYIVNSAKSVDDNSDNIIKTRTYDLHITYDKYYQVPRLWLIGYDEAMRPLPVHLMMEDFSQDHANKTATYEAHPHLNYQYLITVHPCRHADTMKRLIDQFALSGKELNVDQYLIIFLKFIQAVIPTIEYDFTRSISL